MAIRYYAAMRLPTIAASDDLMRIAMRCLLDWSRPLGEERAIDRATTITNPALAAAGDANVAFVADAPTAAIFDEVASELAKESRSVIRYVIARGGHTFLRSNWTHEPYDVHRLANWVAPAAETDLKIIPARAALPQAEALLSHIWAGDPIQTAAAVGHLDDPRYELLIVLDKGIAVACGGMLISGDAGWITYVYTRPTSRRRGYAKAICDRLIDLAARASLKHVLLAVEPQNADAVRMYHGMGFEKVGAFDEWHAPVVRP